MWELLLILCLLSGLKKSLSQNISGVDGTSVAREKPESHRLQHVAYFFGWKTASCFFARCRLSSSWGEAIIWSFDLLCSVRYLYRLVNTFIVFYTDCFLLLKLLFSFFLQGETCFFSHARIFNCLFLRIKYG